MPAWTTRHPRTQSDFHERRPPQFLLIGTPNLLTWSPQTFSSVGRKIWLWGWSRLRSTVTFMPTPACRTIPHGQSCGARRSSGSCLPPRKNVGTTSWRRETSKATAVCRPSRLVSQGARLHSNHAHQLLHRRCALVQSGFLFRRQLDFDDLLDSLRAELHRHSNVEAVDAVLALQVRSARQDLFLVLEDRFDHFRRCC